MTISVNDFVRRQVKGSGRTYSSTMSFEEIASTRMHKWQRANSGKDTAMGFG